MTRKIIIHCDPGHDDAMAILLAHGSPEVEICAITTVAGNQTLEKTTLNARRCMHSRGDQRRPNRAGMRPSAFEKAYDIARDPWRIRPRWTQLRRTHRSSYRYPRRRPDHRSCHGVAWRDLLVPIGPLTNIAMAWKRATTRQERARGGTDGRRAHPRETRHPLPSSTSSSTPKPPQSSSRRAGRSR